MTSSLILHAVPGIPLVEPGDDIAVLILAALAVSELVLEVGDVLVLAQKIVSKAEGRYAYLNGVEPSAEAVELAGQCDKDPRHMQVVLNESSGCGYRRACTWLCAR
jgi:coenzyme F420-0:L-glutamate ligase/coenzyme F420-1:gamma-L-glutamate ligase